MSGKSNYGLTYHLTPVECETVRLMACGLTNKEIADKRAVKVPTVVRHTNNIFLKLHLTNRTQLALYALRHGIVTLDEACAVAGIGEVS